MTRNRWNFLGIHIYIYSSFKSASKKWIIKFVLMKISQSLVEFWYTWYRTQKFVSRINLNVQFPSPRILADSTSKCGRGHAIWVKLFKVVPPYWDESSCGFCCTTDFFLRFEMENSEIFKIQKYNKIHKTWYDMMFEYVNHDMSRGVLYLLCRLFSSDRHVIVFGGYKERFCRTRIILPTFFVGMDGGGGLLEGTWHTACIYLYTYMIRLACVI